MGQGFKLYYYKTSTMQLPQGYIDLEKVCIEKYFFIDCFSITSTVETGYFNTFFARKCVEISDC